jgi:hypothetical protein
MDKMFHSIFAPIPVNERVDRTYNKRSFSSTELTVVLDELLLAAGVGSESDDIRGACSHFITNFLEGMKGNLDLNRQVAWETQGLRQINSIVCLVSDLLNAQQFFSLMRYREAH